MNKVCIACAPKLMQADVKGWERSRDSYLQRIVALQNERLGVREVGIAGRQVIDTELTLAKRNLARAKQVLSDYTLVQPPCSCAKVGIGTVVTFRYLDANEDQIGEPATVLIGGYGSSDLPREPGSPVVIAYDQRLGMQLMERAVGAIFDYSIPSKGAAAIEIVGIGLPAETALAAPDASAGTSKIAA